MENQKQSLHAPGADFFSQMTKWKVPKNLNDYFKAHCFQCYYALYILWYNNKSVISHCGVVSVAK